MTDYTVEVTREGKSWLADVRGLPGVHTWAKNLPSLEASLREAIALAEDLPDGAEQSVGLRFEYHIGDERLDRLTAELRRKRARLEAEEAALAARTSQAAAQLVHDAQLPVRDVAVLLAVSPQRVSQVAPQRGVARRRPGR